MTPSVNLVEHGLMSGKTCDVRLVGNREPAKTAPAHP